MRLISPAEAPAWLMGVLRDIERGLRAPFTSPVRLQEFAAPANLPLASAWRAGIVFVKSIDMVAVSDGTNWRRLDTGAII